MLNLIKGWVILGAAISFLNAEAATDWARLQNKYGWEIDYPSCLSVDVGSYGGEAKDSPMVFFTAGKSCPEIFSGLMVDIDLPDIKPKDIKRLLSTTAEITRDNKIEFEYEDMVLKPAKLRAIKSFSNRDYGNGIKKTIVWKAFSNCGNRNLHYYMEVPVPKETENLPLKKQKMPEVLRKITESFVCTKP